MNPPAVKKNYLIFFLIILCVLLSIPLLLYAFFFFRRDIVLLNNSQNFTVTYNKSSSVFKDTLQKTGVWDTNTSDKLRPIRKITIQLQDVNNNKDTQTTKALPLTSTYQIKKGIFFSELLLDVKINISSALNVKEEILNNMLAGDVIIFSYQSAHKITKNPQSYTDEYAKLLSPLTNNPSNSPFEFSRKSNK